MLNLKACYRAVAVCAVLLLASGCDSTTPEQHLASAEERYVAGEYRSAVIELKNALQKDANLVAARALLGQTYLRQGDFPSALKELERALDLGDTSTSVRVGVQRARLGLGRHAEIIGELADLAGRPVELDLILGDAYLSAGEPDAAERLYERGRETASGLSGLAAIAWQRGDVTAAGELFARSIERPVDDPQIWIRKAEFELATGALDAAVSSFEKAAEFPAGRVFGGIGRVRALLADDRLEEAAGAIDGVLELAPRYPLARYLEGLIRYQTEDFDSAEAALREVQRQFPDHEPSLYLMGLVKYQLGQLAQAEYNVERFVAVTPDNESARKLLASIQIEQQKLKPAIEVLLPVSQTTQDPQLLAMLGTALTQEGRPAEAAGFLSRAVELAPDGAAFRNQLALSLLSSGKEELARSELESAIEVDGNQIQSDYLIAMLQLRDGELAAARSSVESLIAKSPDNPIGPNLLGAVALAEGDQASAEVEFRKALAMEPGFTPALNNLSRLLEAKGDPVAAAQLFKDRAEAAPDDVAAQLGLTEVLVRTGRLGAAVSAAEAAVSADPSSARAQVALVRLYRATDQVQRAETTADAALVALSDSPDLKLLKAELSLADGRREDARTYINELQVLLTQASRKSPELALALGRLQAQLGNRTVARSNYEVAVAATEAQDPVALLELGRLNLLTRQFDAVEEQLTQLAALEGDQIATARTLLRADLAAAQGDVAAATALYEPLLEAGNREAALRLAQLALRDGRSDDGIKLLEERLEIVPNDYGARLLLSSALLAIDRKDEAIRQYEQLRSTGNVVVLNNLAWLYMEKGDQRAIPTGEQAFQAAPQNPDVADTFGWVLVKMGDVARGIDVLERSLTYRRDNPTVLYHLAAGHAKAGQPGRARLRLQQALSRGDFPERGEAEALLAKISES
ncbi:MAG: XrtA/PEP-CTERM system TPR-repeat protein PrsT [Pseudomonadota bacterium]